MRLNIKPLSVNEAWQGKRFKTRKYSAYIREMLNLLPPLDVPSGYIEFEATVGYSNSNADIDNFLKPFIDCLQKKYGFNDNKIYRLIINKEIVKKGDEFIEWQLNEIQK